VYDIPLAFLRFVPLESNPSLQAFSYSEAVSNNFVRGAVFFYAGNGNYDFLTDIGAPLRPWVGYWIFVNQPVTLIFSAPGQLNTAILPAPITNQNTDPFPATRKRGEGDMASGHALVRRPTMNNWKLQFVARSRSGERRDTATLIGVGAGAKDGDDVRDLLKPPAFKDYVYVAVSRGAGRTGRLMQDLKAGDGAKKTWDLEVESDHDGPVTVAWPNVASLPRTLRLRVTDMGTGRTYDLRSMSSLRLHLARNTVHRLRVTADRRLSKPLALSNVTATQVGGRGTSAAMKIEYNVTTDARVVGQVRNLVGEVVSMIAPSRAVGAGKQAMHWNRRSREGNALPAGPYMLELTARTDDGEQVTVTRPMTLLR
jgi:hypothetical protein